MTTTTCSYGASEDTPGCGREATHQVVLQLRPFAGCATTEAVIDWYVCHRHRKLITPDDVLTDIGWAYIMADHKRSGRLVPVKALTSVRFRRM